MALTRNDVTFDEIGGLEITYKSNLDFDRTVANGHAQAGKAPVKLIGPRTVALAGDGERVHGKLLRVEPDGKAMVKVRGYCTLAGSGTLVEGGAILGAGGNKVKAAATTDGYKGKGEIVDASDATAVWVFLG